MCCFCSLADLDTSAKPPPALLQGSVSSFGDYDECLEINSHLLDRDHITSGQYCLVRFSIHSGKSSRLQVTNHLLDLHPIADYYYPLHGLCIPSGCSRDDLQTLLTQVIFPSSNDNFKLQEITHCDTKESISFQFSRLVGHQQISIVFLALFTLLTILGTLFHMLGLSWLRKHSALANISALLDPGTQRDISADCIKCFFAMYAVAIHSIVAVTTPIGIYVLSRLYDIEQAIKIVWIQPFINVHGLHGISLISGITMGFSTYQESKKHFTLGTMGKMIVDRWIRNAPGVLCYIALELVWPLAGTGPLYTFVGNDVIDNCASNWWRNVLFITNYNPVSQNCANHTFWSSVDFHLFIVGLIVIFTLKKSRTLAILLMLTLVTIDFAYTGYTSVKYNTTHSMATFPISVGKVVEYVDRIHNPTTTYLFTFIVGLSMGIYYTEYRAPDLGAGSLVLALLSLQSGAYSTAIYNEWSKSNSTVKQMTWLYYIVVKSLYTLSFTLLMTFLVAQGQAKGRPSRVKREQKVSHDKEENNNTLHPTDVAHVNGDGHANGNSNGNASANGNGHSDGNGYANGNSNGQTRSVADCEVTAKNNVQNDSSLGYRLFMALSRLSTALYLVNYWFIRYDFFTAYAPFEASKISFFKRFGYSICFAEILAFFFHVIFLAPIDLYRKHYIAPLFKAKRD